LADAAVRRRIAKMLQDNVCVRWLTPAGQKEQNLAYLVEELEEQFGSARSERATHEALLTP